MALPSHFPRCHFLLQGGAGVTEKLHYFFLGPSDFPCPKPYSHYHGDVPGRGFLNYDNVNNVETCAEKCEQNSNCCSFEWYPVSSGPSSLNCNLNEECEPGDPGPDVVASRNEVFCVKRGQSPCPEFEFKYETTPRKRILGRFGESISTLGPEVVDNVYSWQECGKWLEGLGGGVAGNDGEGRGEGGRRIQKMTIADEGK